MMMVMVMVVVMVMVKFQCKIIMMTMDGVIGDDDYGYDDNSDDDNHGSLLTYIFQGDFKSTSSTYCLAS